MSEIITFPLPGGPNFTIPDVGDENWGQSVTDYLVAIPLGVPPTSGTFTLTGDLYFGASFGLVSQYFKSPTINPATAGIVRLAKTDLIDWRNNANSGDNVLAVNSSDQLTFNGAVLTTGTSGNLTDTGTDGITIIGGTGAVLGSGTTIAQHVADTTHNGYLSSADWNTFSSASGTVTSVSMTVPAFLSVSGSPITSSGTLAVSLSGTALPIANGGTAVTSLGNLTDAGTDGIVITSGTGAVIHNTSIAQTKADATHNGYLSSTDWSTFNSAAGGGITSLTGDVTGTGPGATATTLATVNSNVGSFTNANITVNAKGLITAASNGSGSGTVNSGTAGNLAYYASSTNAVSTMPNLQIVASGNTTFTVDGSGVGSGATIRVLGSGVTTANLGLDASGGSFTLSSSGTTTYKLTDSTNSIDFLTYSHPSAGLLTSGVVLAMGSNKITSLANGTASTDAATFGQINYLTAPVQTISSTNFATTSSTYQNTNLSASISPSSSSSRVKITASGPFTINAATNITAVLSIFRGTTNLATGPDAAFMKIKSAAAQQGYYPASIVFIDSPASTSSLTYTIKIKNSDNTTTTEFGQNEDQIIILEEIR